MSELVHISKIIEEQVKPKLKRRESMPPKIGVTEGQVAEIETHSTETVGVVYEKAKVKRQRRPQRRAA